MSYNDNYDPWIAQGYREDAEEAESDAEGLLAAGEHSAAADKYEEAADHLREYEKYTGKSEQSEINRLESRAGELRASGSDGESSASDGDSIEDGVTTEELRRRVEAFITTTEVEWDDIGGLEETKEQICHEIGLGAVSGLPEAVQPSDSILLFGPPGTGKTQLASAVANGTDTTFFNVKLGGLLSKWQGESSQLVATLFAVAREHAPAVVFIDEIDALTQARSGESDSASRRVQNSLLTELDGVNKHSEEFLMVIGSTNRPMDLDDAVVRRFDTRIHVPLPDEDGATEIVRIHTVKGDIEFSGAPEEFAPRSEDIAETVPRTLGKASVRRGFSGSDIATLCRMAISRMVQEENPHLAERARGNIEALGSEDVTLRPLRPRDVQEAFDNVSSSVPESSLREYEAWAEEFGSG